MKTTMKLAALAALAMGCSTAALADNNSVEFKSSIQVVGADYCGLDVVAGGADGKSNWGLTWTLEKADAETGILAMKDDNTTDPLNVKVGFKPGSAAKCSLGQLTFGAKAADATYMDKGAFKRVTTNGGFWRYMPVVAKLALFKDAELTKAIELTKVKVTDAAGTQHTQAAAAAGSAKADITSDAFTAENVAMSLTDNYLTASGVAPLNNGAGDSAVTFALDADALAEGEAVKGALIGVGALVAKNPEDADGRKKLDAVSDGQSVKLPFTVVVNNP